MSGCGVTRDETPRWEAQWRTGYLKDTTSPLIGKSCRLSSVTLHSLSHEIRVRGEADITEKNILLCQDTRVPSGNSFSVPLRETKIVLYRSETSSLAVRETATAHD